MMISYRIFILFTCVAALVGCSTFESDDLLPDKSVEYKREEQAGQNLEIPPDLTSARINDRMSVPDTFSSGTTYSEYMVDRRARGIGAVAASAGVLPENPTIQVMRDGDARWLMIEGDADPVWDRVLDFWQDQGILLVEQDPEVGVMLTSWLENRASISRDFLTDAIRSVFDGLYETSQRDAYRVRLERVSGNTELYLTHYGMQEELSAGSGGDADLTIWTPRPRDPELEVEMLRRLMVFLGTAEDRAQARLNARARDRETRSQLVQGSDGVKLVIAEDFPRAWRLVGLSLDRVGFAVEDRDRSNGTYYVRYNDPAAQAADEGLLGKLAFWSDDEEPETEYRIRLSPLQTNTLVQVYNSQDQLEQSDTAKRILNLLREQLR